MEGTLLTALEPALLLGLASMLDEETGSQDSRINAAAILLVWFRAIEGDQWRSTLGNSFVENIDPEKDFAVYIRIAQNQYASPWAGKVACELIKLWIDYSDVNDFPEYELIVQALQELTEGVTEGVLMDNRVFEASLQHQDRFNPQELAAFITPEDDAAKIQRMAQHAFNKLLVLKRELQVSITPAAIVELSRFMCERVDLDTTTNSLLDDMAIVTDLATNLAIEREARRILSEASMEPAASAA